MPPTTRNRVPANTNESVNEDIQRQIEERVRYYAGHPGKIPRRLRELDRALVTNAGTNAPASAFANVAMPARCMVDAIPSPA